MFDIEEQGESEFGQFGALIVEQQAMVSRFCRGGKKGSNLDFVEVVPSRAPRHNEGEMPQGEGGNVDSTQFEDLGNPIDHGMETESLKVELQHLREPWNPKFFRKVDINNDPYVVS